MTLKRKVCSTLQVESRFHASKWKFGNKIKINKSWLEAATWCGRLNYQPQFTITLAVTHPHSSWQVKGWRSQLWSPWAMGKVKMCYAHELFPFADCALYPFSVINHHQEYAYMRSSVSPASESSNHGVVSGTCNTALKAWSSTYDGSSIPGVECCWHLFGAPWVAGKRQINARCSLTHSLTQQFNKYLLNSCYVADAVLGAKIAEVLA